MKSTSTTETLTWNWNEEVFNEKTSEYEMLERETELTVLVEYECESRASYCSGGEPASWSVELLDEDGDELPSSEWEEAQEYVLENFFN